MTGIAAAILAESGVRTAAWIVLMAAIGLALAAGCSRISTRRFLQDLSDYFLIGAVLAFGVSAILFEAAP